MTVREWSIGCGAAGCVAWVVPGFAAEPPRTAKPTFDDAKVAMKVKGAFATDPDLAKANLFVSVLDGVVVVQGPVSSVANRDRIKTVASAIPGVSAVNVDCFIISGADPLSKAVGERLDPKPATAIAIVERGPAIGLPSVAVGPISSASDEVISRRQVDLPVIPELPAAPSTPRPYPTIPSPNVPVGSNAPSAIPVSRSSDRSDVSTEEIAFSLIDLRKSDARFAGLTATIVDGVVTVTGQGDRSEFAKRAKELPGVVGVK